MSKKSKFIQRGECGAAYTSYSTTKQQDNCEQCKRLATSVRSCLRCGTAFEPGCKYPHTCHTCLIKKPTQDELGASSGEYKWHK